MSPKLLEEVVGLGLDEADSMIRDAGFRYRVVHRDGENYVCTMDYCNDRLNLSITDRKITKVSIG